MVRHHIASVADAYQNIAKNTPQMARGNFTAFDEVLKWASQPARTKAELNALFDYSCTHVASTARPVLPMPELDQGKLTFATVMSILVEMLEEKSAGAFEQFIVAALLHARLEQERANARVETKSLNASDSSARAAADIQIKVGSKVEEAFEVTGNLWSEKVDGVGKTIRDFDLSRLHVVASVPHQAYQDMLRNLLARKEDISVLDLRAFVSVLVSELRRAGRLSAFRRLYDLLERLQPNIDLVNRFVARLKSHPICVESPGL